MVISILRYLTTNSNVPRLTLNGERPIEFKIHIDKMSRVIISEEDKMHSFHFPFSIKDEREALSVFFKGRKIEPAMVSVLTSIFTSSNHSSLVAVLERFWNAIEELGVSPNDEDYLAALIMHLLAFEVGYLRFDHDPANQKDQLHPLNHIDINYSNQATLKVGVTDKLSHENFIDILNVTTPCYTLKNTWKR